MKRQSLTILVVLLATVALVGCGVPQEDYDQVVSDLAAAQAEIASLKTDLAAAQSESSDLQDELDAAIAEYEGLQAEYDDLQTWCEGLQTEYDDLNAYVDRGAKAINDGSVYHSVVVELLGPAVTGDGLNEPEVKRRVGYLVDEAGDDGLKQRYDAWSASTWNRALAYELLWHAQVELEDIIFEMDW